MRLVDRIRRNLTRHLIMDLTSSLPHGRERVLTPGRCDARRAEYRDVMEPLCTAQAHLGSHLDGGLGIAGVMAWGELQRACYALQCHLEDEGIIDHE